MNKEEFINLSLHPNEITKEDIVGLESVLEEFPYFQTAQILHLSGLKQQKSIRYNNVLKKVAAYTTNRTVLFDFITAEVLNYEEAIFTEEDTIHNLEVIDSEVIDYTEKEQKEIDVVISEAFQVKTLIQIEKKLELGEPIIFTKEEQHPFDKFLEVMPPKIIQRKEKEVLEKTSDNKSSKLDKQVNLIEKFILKKPKIKPPKKQVNNDVAIESVEENTTLMTATLARVYIEQGKYDKAISAFKILSLKYPEKSGFFADKIRTIKILQKNKS